VKKILLLTRKMGNRFEIFPVEGDEAVFTVLTFDDGSFHRLGPEVESGKQTVWFGFLHKTSTNRPTPCRFGTFLIP